MKTDRYEGQLSAVLLKATAAENITHQYTNTCKKVSKTNKKTKTKKEEEEQRKKGIAVVAPIHNITTRRRKQTKKQANKQTNLNKNKTLSIVASQLF